MNDMKIYRAAVYVRLSKEDGDSASFGKNESNSITNQKLLIRSFLARQPDIEAVETFEDDGYTGTSFDRPGFQRLVTAVREKRVNCVIVKDFSRLGRDYLEAGNYIEKVFPKLGVRFISVNDDYDSLHQRAQVDSLIVPFKNLLNEQYSRDTSGKVRSALAAKRQQGLFVGSFAVYGYFRDPTDKNRLVVDETAAEVVREMFRMKLEGMSYQAIADRMTARKLPSPAEYKRQCGAHYQSGFQTELHPAWSATAVKRILTNEIYCGHMVQGKRRKVSYKVQAEERLPPEKWVRVENTHEAIVSESLFQEVQRQSREDTHVNANQALYPLAGKLYCADCGGPMVHHSVPCGGKIYHYYICGNHRTNSKWCSSHSIPARQVEAAVLAALQAHISVILDMERAFDSIDRLAWEQREVKKLRLQMDALDAEIQQNEDLRLSVYEDLKAGIIERTDYEALRRGFADRIAEAKEAQAKLRSELNALLAGKTEQQSFLNEFRRYENLRSLERGVVVALIERVQIRTGHEIDIRFRYADQFASLTNYLQEQADHRKEA